jgi:phosphate uptake regulator
MLRELFQAFRRQDEVKQLAGQIGQMLRLGRWMFQTAEEVLMRQSDWHEVSDELYAKDRQINQAEQEIRQRIVTHLSLGNQSDVGPCLALMSVVKDAERIGDYCKNIFEVGKFYRQEFSHPEFISPLKSIRDEILDLFEQTELAFVNEDRKQAQKVCETVAGLAKQCDLLVQQLLGVRGESLEPDEAVAYTLLTRHYKRVSAHLSNIATSIISSVPLLDFRKG